MCEEGVPPREVPWEGGEAGGPVPPDPRQPYSSDYKALAALCATQELPAFAPGAVAPAPAGSGVSWSHSPAGAGGEEASSQPQHPSAPGPPGSSAPAPAGDQLFAPAAPRHDETRSAGPSSHPYRSASRGGGATPAPPLPSTLEEGEPGGGRAAPAPCPCPLTPPLTASGSIMAC